MTDDLIWKHAKIDRPNLFYGVRLGTGMIGKLDLDFLISSHDGHP